MTDLLLTTLPLGVALDDSRGWVYWVSRYHWWNTPTSEGSILRAPRTGGAPETVLAGLPRPRHLALDPAAGHLYWTDQESIRRANLDGSDPVVLLSDAALPAELAGFMRDPVGLALDLAGGRLYWVNHKSSDGSRPGILSARLDGSDPRAIVDSGLSGPQCLALDPARGWIYWTETTGDRIRRVPMGGGAPGTVVVSSSFADLAGIALDLPNQVLYAADYNAGFLFRVSTAGGAIGTLHDTLNGPWDVTLDRPPVSPARPLTAGRWRQVALPCDVLGDDAVAQVFGDLQGTYGADWGLYRYSPASRSYQWLTTADRIEAGRGYWIRTELADQAASVEGIEHDTGQLFQIPLADHPDGEWTMVGHPFHFDVDWAGALVRYGEAVLTLDQADPLVGGGAIRACSTSPPDPSCVMSRIAYRWGGSAYEAFNGETPGAEGTLHSWDGFWVRAFKPAVLLLPAVPSLSGSALPGDQAAGTSAGPVRTGRDDVALGRGWHLRLVAESDHLRDAANLLGMLPDALEGYDRHDLPELPPFDSDYLTVVFPRPDWGIHAGDYTTDFRPLMGVHTRGQRAGRRETWPFEVRSGLPDRKVVLRWQGPKEILHRSFLVDLDAPGHRDPRSARQMIPAWLVDHLIVHVGAQPRRFEWLYIP